MVTPACEQVSLADAKARLSEVVEGIETEHRRVVITKHGRPSVVVLAVEDLYVAGLNSWCQWWASLPLNWLPFLRWGNPLVDLFAPNNPIVGAAAE